MNKYYLTFPQNNLRFIDYVLINADSEQSATTIFKVVYGKDCVNCYNNQLPKPYPGKQFKIHQTINQRLTTHEK